MRLSSLELVLALVLVALVLALRLASVLVRSVGCRRRQARARRQELPTRVTWADTVAGVLCGSVGSNIHLWEMNAGLA